MYKFVVNNNSFENKYLQAKIIRESKLIPNLIYVVEQYEGNLIKLSKKSKVNLTQNMKRSTARDFRIVVEMLPEPSSSDEEEVVIKRVCRGAVNCLFQIR